MFNCAHCHFADCHSAERCYAKHLLSVILQSVILLSVMLRHCAEPLSAQAAIYFVSMLIAILSIVMLMVSYPESHYADCYAEFCGAYGFAIWGQCYKTFYVCNLRILVIS